MNYTHVIPQRLAPEEAIQTSNLQTPSLIPLVPDKFLIVVLPVAVYWIFSLCFQLCDDYGWLSKYKLHTPEEFLKRNRVSMRDVVQGVLVQHALQVVMGIGLAYFEADEIIDEQQGVLAWAQRVRLVRKYAPSLLAVTGIDFLAIMKRLNLSVQPDMAMFNEWEVAVAKVLYHFVVS